MRYVSVLTIACLTVLSASTEAGDFRIETKVYKVPSMIYLNRNTAVPTLDVQNEDELVSENLTLFHAGIVYDFLSGPKTVTIFHPPMHGAAGRFIVLDRTRSVKMEVTTHQIQGLLAKLRDWAAGQEDEYLQFLAEPNFVEESSSDGESLTLTSEHMTYKLQTTKPTDGAALEAYRQFSDWYARFNVRGGMLPFPRLEVNKALYRRNCIPTEVVLKVPAQKLEMRSEHILTWRLSLQDRKLIEEALEQMGSFLRVDPEEFLHGRLDRAVDAAAAGE